MKDTQQFLEEYKKYDYLNQESKNPLIKIFVSYIKSSFLFKSEILTPIHLGRAVAKDSSKDGVVGEEDLKWLYENCIGDDDFEGNISNTNRRVGFLTGTYWVWKNYEKLGNPEYFGSFGYRRLLDPSFLEDFRNYDIILPEPVDFRISTIKNQFINCHSEMLYKNTFDVLNKFSKNLQKGFEQYCCGTKGYFFELYVLKKEIFFDFCSWIFPILSELLKLPQVVLKNNDFRDIGFIIERLSGYYFSKFDENKYKIKNVNIFLADDVIIDKSKLKDKYFLSLLRNRAKGVSLNE